MVSILVEALLLQSAHSNGGTVSKGGPKGRPAGRCWSALAAYRGCLQQP